MRKEERIDERPEAILCPLVYAVTRKERGPPRVAAIHARLTPQPAPDVAGPLPAAALVLRARYHVGVRRSATGADHIMGRLHRMERPSRTPIPAVRTRRPTAQKGAPWPS